MEKCLLHALSQPPIVDVLSLMTDEDMGTSTDAHGLLDEGLPPTFIGAGLPKGNVANRLRRSETRLLEK